MLPEGVVTVPFNLPIDGQDWSTYVGTDPEKKGKTLGGWLNKALGGKGKIVGLGGLPGNSYTAAGWAGAKAAFDPGIEILAFQDAYWEEDKAKVIMADLITAYPEIDGVWCDGAQVATGAMKALLAAKRPLVPVISDDYNGLLKLFKAEKPTHQILEPTLITAANYEKFLRPDLPDGVFTDTSLSDGALKKIFGS